MAGQDFTYRLEVQSLPGGSDAQGVTVTDILPAGLTPTGAVASQGSCTITGQDCELRARYRPGLRQHRPAAKPFVTITGTVDATLSGPITNKGVVDSDTPDLVSRTRSPTLLSKR